MISVVLAYHEEGQSFLMECINQLYDTIHISPFEIIIVDDCSSTPLAPIENVIIIRNTQRSGVGFSFDQGVMNSKYENIILMAPDIRFTDNGWAELLLKEIDEHPDSLVCTTCVGDNHKWCGATILIFHDHISNPRKLPHFRGLFEAQWLPYEDGESREVPCILGACYAVKKSWYNYIDGFWGHYLWSNLESYISIKSYLFGGSCRVVPKAETRHIFKKKGTNLHKIPQEAMVYNKLLIARLLFDDSDRYINFLGTDPNVQKAKRLFNSRIEDIARKRLEYQDKMVSNIDDYASKFSLNLRK